MRQITYLLLMLGAAGVARAHTIDGGNGILDQLHHQTMAPHHLPVTLLLIAGCLMQLRVCMRKGRS